MLQSERRGKEEEEEVFVYARRIMARNCNNQGKKNREETQHGHFGMKGNVRKK